MRKTIKPATSPEVLLGLSQLGRNDFIPLVLIALYMGVEFIPPLGAWDVLGPQWVYLSIINIISIISIFLFKEINVVDAIKDISSSLLTIICLLFLAVAGTSIIVALNKVESLFCFARLITTVLMYFNIAILLYGRMNLFSLLSKIISIILFIQAYQVLSQFYSEIQQSANLDTVVSDIKLNTGHKNILAASMAFKLPFLIYNIYKSTFGGKLINILVFMLATCSIVIINARSAYVTVLIEFFIYSAFCFLQNKESKSIKKAVSNISYIVIPFFIGVILSNLILNTTKPGDDTKGMYGTFSQRLSSIGMSDEGSSSRTWLWHNSISYIKHHLLGCGYGNWKLASIPYERNVINDLIVTCHVHNDFLETTAETGIIGGLLFLSIFATAIWLLIRLYFKKQDVRLQELSAFTLMAIISYMIDASLNFPGERPIMQFYFAFALALCYNLSLPVEKKISLLKKKEAISKNWFAGIGLLFIIPALILHITYYKSSVAQAEYSFDALDAAPKKNWADVKDAFPSIPNMNALCVPIGAIKAKYLIKENKFDNAFSMLNQCDDINPGFGYNDYLKGMIYFNIGKMDSAFYYADKAFSIKPREKAFYALLLNISIKLRDSATVNKIFKTEVELRNDDWLWNDYIAAMYGFNIGKQRLIALTDSALKLFPKNDALKQKKINLATADFLNQYLASAIKSFEQNDYKSALDYFKKAAEVDTSDHFIFENVGLCYYKLNDFKNAIIWFNKAILIRKLDDGKSEFYIGMANIGLGNKNEGCRYLQIADARHFKDAKLNISNFCK